MVKKYEPSRKWLISEISSQLLFCILLYFCPAWTFFGNRHLHYDIPTNALMFIWYSLLCLTIQNSHLFRNVIQCKTRRKHMRTNWQRQYKLLHSYMDDCCIRWCLQEQYHIVKYMKTVTSIYVLLSISVIQSWTVSISWVSPVSTDWNPCCVASNFRILQPFYTRLRKHARTWLLEILASLDAFKILGYQLRLACFTV